MIRRAASKVPLDQTSVRASRVKHFLSHPRAHEAAPRIIEILDLAAERAISFSVYRGRGRRRRWRRAMGTISTARLIVPSAVYQACRVNLLCVVFSRARGEAERGALAAELFCFDKSAEADVGRAAARAMGSS